MEHESARPEGERDKEGVEGDKHVSTQRTASSAGDVSDAAAASLKLGQPVHKLLIAMRRAELSERRSKRKARQQQRAPNDAAETRDTDSTAKQPRHTKRAMEVEEDEQQDEEEEAEDEEEEDEEEDEPDRNTIRSRARSSPSQRSTPRL